MNGSEQRPQNIKKAELSENQESERPKSKKPEELGGHRFQPMPPMKGHK